jgi:asparagine synthase (glutamine-hydrolysing)
MRVGGIAAALNKRGEDAVSLVLLMLKQLTHRGADVFHVATPTSTLTSKSLDELETKKLVSNTAVGHNSSLNLPREKHTPVLQEKNYALVFEGRLFPPSKTFDIDEVARCLKPGFQKGTKDLIRKFDGSYTFAIALPEKIVAGRDSFGTNPLFYGENETFCALASERKALWTLGITNAKSFPPGNLVVISAKGFDFSPVAIVTQPSQRRMRIDKAANRLHSLLLNSIMERVSDMDEVAVAFSGGLDSAVLAVLAKNCSVKVNLVTVGLKGQLELVHAAKAAESLKLPIHLQTYTIADVENVLEKVLWLIEEPDVMKLGVAISLFWAAETASHIGCRVLLAGQGADEMFGGYHRYLTEYKNGGVKAVQKSLFHDVAMSYETNFQRDNAVCAFHKVELRLLYIDREVIRFALSLPVNLKINSVNDLLRKRVLRHVAKNIGISEFIAKRSKKAVQYATGVDKALRELSRRRGLTQRDYIQQIFEKIYPNWKSET